MRDSLSRVAAEETRLPNLRERWNDRTLPSSERYTAYQEFLRHLGSDLARILGREKNPIVRAHLAPEIGYDAVWSEYERITAHTYSEHAFVEEQDRLLFAPILGERLLGCEAWKRASGADLGVVPPVPCGLTVDTLLSPCPLHPGKLVKDTHFLTLVPAQVDRRALTIVELVSRCGYDPHSERQIVWDNDLVVDELRTLAVGHRALPESRWALVAESDPEQSATPPEKLLRGRNSAEQEEAVRTHYPEYQLAHPLEVITTIFLNRIMNGKRLLHDLILRCAGTEGADGRRFCVGPYRGGLIVMPQGSSQDSFFLLGAALKRRL